MKSNKIMLQLFYAKLEKKLLKVSKKCLLDVFENISISKISQTKSTLIFFYYCVFNILLITDSDNITFPDWGSHLWYTPLLLKIHFPSPLLFILIKESSIVNLTKRNFYQVHCINFTLYSCTESFEAIASPKK